MKKVFLTMFLLLSINLGSVLTVYAQPCPGEASSEPCPPTQPTIKLENPFRGGNSLFALLQSVINDILLPIGAVICVLAFIYSGFKYVTARGNEKKVGEAHQALLYTVIGTALLLGAWVFANAICGTLELISNRNICPTNPTR